MTLLISFYRHRSVQMANKYAGLVALTGVWTVPHEMYDEFIGFTNVHAELW